MRGAYLLNYSPSGSVLAFNSSKVSIFCPAGNFLIIMDILLHKLDKGLLPMEYLPLKKQVKIVFERIWAIWKVQLLWPFYH